MYNSRAMTSVRFDGISRRFGDTVALQDINLKIDRGELFFLLGPSGCGKSTLLRVVAGLLPPSDGRIYFDDRDVTALGTEKRNAVMCFQSYALWPHMTVRENVRFGLNVRGVSKADQDKKVDEVLRLVQMQPLADRRPNQLSGGQQQRVALARALVVEPACLLLDEPLSNLDAKLRLEMRQEIRRICKRANLTAIYVTHDQKEALSIADRVAVLDRGRIAQLGSPREVYGRPVNPFVASFIGETNFIDGTIERLDGKLAYVSTAVGQFVSAAYPAKIAPGDQVVISIRPESVRLGDVPAGAVNAFDGQLHDTVYLGEVSQHQVNIGTGDTPVNLKAFELNPRYSATDHRTAQVRIWIDPEDVVTLCQQGARDA